MLSARDVTDNLHIKVIELYPAVQGEGLLTGVPSTFVRLAGCTVGCVYCDTKYSWKAAQGIQYLPKDLAKYTAHETTHGHVVVTGGEPLEHPHELLLEFFDSLRNHLTPAFCHITVETSGTVLPPVQLIDLVDLWSIAPKLAGAKSTKSFPDLIAWIESVYSPADLQFKFVITSADDLVEVVNHLEKIEPALQTHDVPIILQTCSPYQGEEQDVREQIVRDTKLLQQTVVDNQILNRFNVRILPQLHAILHGAKRGI